MAGNKSKVKKPDGKNLSKRRNSEDLAEGDSATPLASPPIRPEDERGILEKALDVAGNVTVGFFSRVAGVGLGWAVGIGGEIAGLASTPGQAYDAITKETKGIGWKILGGTAAAFTAIGAIIISPIALPIRAVISTVEGLIYGIYDKDGGKSVLNSVAKNDGGLLKALIGYPLLAVGLTISHVAGASLGLLIGPVKSLYESGRTLINTFRESYAKEGGLGFAKALGKTVFGSIITAPIVFLRAVRAIGQGVYDGATQGLHAIPNWKHFDTAEKQEADKLSARITAINLKNNPPKNPSSGTGPTSASNASTVVDPAAAATVLPAVTAKTTTLTANGTQPNIPIATAFAATAADSKATAASGPLPVSSAKLPVPIIPAATAATTAAIQPEPQEQAVHTSIGQKIKLSDEIMREIISKIPKSVTIKENAATGIRLCSNNPKELTEALVTITKASAEKSTWTLPDNKDFTKDMVEALIEKEKLGNKLEKVTIGTKEYSVNDGKLMDTPTLAATATIKSK